MAGAGKSRRSPPSPESSAPVELAVGEIRWGERTDEGYTPVVLASNRGDVETRYYPLPGSAKGAVFVGGAGGGFDTPVRGWLYPRLCRSLQHDGIAGLRVRYRDPHALLEAVLDVMAGIAFLQSEGVRHVALVGHSFGGAVVIQAAHLSDAVRTCVPLSTQTYGVDPAPLLSPRCSLLMGHGTADEVLPHRCSQYVYDIAGEPKKLLLKEGARHGLDEWADELPGILQDWIRSELERAVEASAPARS